MRARDFAGRLPRASAYRHTPENPLRGVMPEPMSIMIFPDADKTQGKPRDGCDNA